MMVEVGSIAKVAVDITGASGALQLLLAGGAVALVVAVGFYGAYKILQLVYSRHSEGKVSSDGQISIPETVVP